MASDKANDRSIFSAAVNLHKYTAGYDSDPAIH